MSRAAASCEKEEEFIATHICFFLSGWRPRKLVTLTASRDGKQVAGDGGGWGNTHCFFSFVF